MPQVGNASVSQARWLVSLLLSTDTNRERPLVLPSRNIVILYIEYLICQFALDSFANSSYIELNVHFFKMTNQTTSQYLNAISLYKVNFSAPR